MAMPIGNHHHLLACVLLLLLVTADAVMSGGSRRGERPQIEEADAGGFRTYIILLWPPPPSKEKEMDDAARRAWHESFLPSKTTTLGEPRLVFSYRTVFAGFAARLTEEELRQVSLKPGFIRAFNNTIRYLHDDYW